MDAIKMYFRCVIATIILIFRTLFFPFYLVRNFFLLRFHRYKYKKTLKNGRKKFSDKISYLDALRSQVDKDISSAYGSSSFSGDTFEFLRFHSKGDHK